MPFSVEEFQRESIYGVAMKNDEGIIYEDMEVLKHEPFENVKVCGETRSGIYTYKICQFHSKLPWVARKMFSKKQCELHEESWNAYPYCKTVVTNPHYMKKKFSITVESVHLDDDGHTNGVFKFNKKARKADVVRLDIYDEAGLHPQDITEKNNVRTFKSEKTGRGPLEEDWANTTEPVMTAYNLVTAKFVKFGIGCTIEKLIHKQYPRLFTKFHREVFCWIDKWFDMDMEALRDLEKGSTQGIVDLI